MKTNRRVMVTLDANTRRNKSIMAGGLHLSASGTSAIFPKIEGVNWDASFSPLMFPQIPSSGLPKAAPVDGFNKGGGDREGDYYVVRADVDEASLQRLFEQKELKDSAVRGVYADLPIGPALRPWDATLHLRRAVPALDVGPQKAGAVVPAQSIGTVLDVSKLAALQMDGRGVPVAVVDMGINEKFLRERGVRAACGRELSWAPPDGASRTPHNAVFASRYRHGNMCAFDICVAAPECTLLDIPLLTPKALPNAPGARSQTPMQRYLSDACSAYEHLINLLLAAKNHAGLRALVVSNSWSSDPRDDFPSDHPANYSHNLRHPFNEIICRLETLGADIVFAAGHSDDSANWSLEILGANSHPRVLTVSAVDLSKSRTRSSSRGPGSLVDHKPDICAYSCFVGSEAFGEGSSDEGTSAACALVAGVVAAIRSRLPFDPSKPKTTPAELRSILRECTEDCGVLGYDYEYGAGLLNLDRLAKMLDSCLV